MKKICLIGAGTSNCFTAIDLAKEDYQIDIYESNSKPARKLLASGNGRCNIVNKNIDSSLYYNPLFVKNFLMSFDDIKTYLESINVFITNPDEDGRCYPISYHSSTVLDSINARMFRSNINLYLDTIVREITIKNNKYLVNGKEYDYCVIGIGSHADQKIKVNPLEKSIASLGHKYTRTIPSICPLKVKENISLLEGIRSRCNVKLVVDGDVITTRPGELLFKKDEISGIVVFELSTFIAHIQRKHKINECYVEIDLWPECKLKYTKPMTGHQFINGVFVRNLTEAVLKQAGIGSKEEINEVKANKIINAIHYFKLTIDVTKHSDIYQVVCGGIDINDIKENLESKLHNNLFFAGELLDIDGPCGGYNLAMCISTGLHIANSIRDKK